MNHTKLDNSILSTIYNQIYTEIRDYRQQQWKFTFYISILFLSIFTYMMDFDTNKLAKVKIFYFAPEYIFIFLIVLIGLWGFLTILSQSWRFLQLFSTLRRIHKIWHFNLTDPEFFVGKRGGLHDFLQNCFNFGFTLWIPILTIIDIIFITELFKIPKKCTNLICVFYLLIIIIFGIISLHLKKNNLKLGNDIDKLIDLHNSH